METNQKGIDFMNNYNICAECNKEFTGRKKKYCSPECANEAKRRKRREQWRRDNKPKPDVTIICEWCGELHTVPSRTAHQARFCSDDCRYTFRSREKGIKPIDEWITIREKQKRKRQARLEKERLERVVVKHCVWCGDTFETTDTKRLTCSSKCSRKRMNRIKWERKEARLNEKNTIDTDITLIKLYKK